MALTSRAVLLCCPRLADLMFASADAVAHNRT
jgi:hypothetical protein